MIPQEKNAAVTLGLNKTLVDAVPLTATDAQVRIPAALRTLHALPPFPGARFNTTCTFLLNKGPALDGFLEKFRESSILPENEAKELLACYQQVAAVCSGLDSDLAPGHNDLFKPDNMLFDGNREPSPTRTAMPS